MKTGDVFENPATGEYGYVRKGSDNTNGVLLIADLRVKVGGAVLGEHYHPAITERFTILKGRIGYSLNGKTSVAVAGDTLDIPPNTLHDWWNAGDEEARIIVQIKPARRFELMALTLFGLAKEGKTNKKGQPDILQMSVIAKAYADVIRLKNPPSWIQAILFAFVAPFASLLGYKSFYPEYQIINRTAEVEPLPENVIIKEL